MEAQKYFRTLVKKQENHKKYLHAQKENLFNKGDNIWEVNQQFLHTQDKAYAYGNS